MGKIRGYNVILKLNDKLFKGVTENTFKMTPEMEESLTKEDLGKPKMELIDCPAELTITSLMCIKETGETDSHMDVADARTAVKSGALLPFVYGEQTAGAPIVSGSVRITDYSENTNSKDVGQVSITVKTEGDYTLDTAS
jgi:hypothetical protein